MASPNPDMPLLKVDNGQDVAAFTWSANQAADNARQHNGNVYITNSHTHVADPSDKSFDGLNLNAELLLAAGRGRTQRVEYLLGKNASFDHKDENGMTALHHASLSGFEEIVRFLLQRGTDVDASSSLYGSALCLAILKDRVNVTRALLEGRPMVGRATEGIGTELHCASWTGHCEIAAMLLRNGSAVNTKAHISELRMKLLNEQGTVGLSEDVRQKIEASPRITCFPLSLAVLRGHLDLVKLLLENGALVDEDCVWSYPRRPASASKPPYRATSVIVAATHGHHEILKLLIDHGANLGIRNGEGRSALAIAADKGDENCVIALLNASKTQSSTDSEVAFHLAVSGGHTECVRAFCDSNVDVDAVNEDDHTALRVAAQHGDLKTATVLLNAGAKVDGKSTVGSSPLTIAAEKGHVQIVELLLSHGASVATPKHDTGTLFSAVLGHLDSQNGHAMLEALLRPKADDPVSESDLKDILAVLQKRKGSSREEVSAAMVVAAACAGNESSLKSLHRVGADLNSRFSDGQTALHRVARDRHFTGTLRLLKLGAQVNVFDQRGYTPLMNAIKEGQVQMVEEMIRWGANVNDQAKSGLTPVHLAVGCNATEALTALLRGGADTSAQDSVEGNTPLHQAATTDNRAAARLLLQYKASLRIKNKDGHTAEDLARRWSHHDVCDVLEEFRGSAGDESGVAGEDQGSDDILETDPGTENGSEAETRVSKSLNDDDGSATLAESVLDDTPGHDFKIRPDINVEDVEQSRLHKVTLPENPTEGAEHEPDLAHHDGAVLASAEVVKVDKTPSDKTATPEIAKVDKELSEILERARKSDDVGPEGAHEALVEAGFGDTQESYLKDPSKPWLWAMQQDHDDFSLRAIVKLLLEQNAPIDARKDDGPTLLQVAGVKGKVATAALLIASGANIEATVTIRVAVTANTGNREVCARDGSIKETAPTQTIVNKEGYMTILGYVIACGGPTLSLPVLRLLLLAGANIDREDEVFGTLVHITLQSPLTASDGTHLLRFVLEHKPSLDAVDQFGRTALNIAIIMNLLEAVQLLVLGGASVNYGPNICTKDGKPAQWPMMLAITGNKFEIVRILLEHGAKYETIGNKYIILHAAFYGSGMSIKVILDWAKQYPAFLEELKTKDPSPGDLEYLHGLTALHLIANAPAPEVEACLAPLIDLGADVNAFDREGNTPLHAAASAGSAYMVGFLKTQRVDVGQKNSAGKTALQLAMDKRHEKVVELLGGQLPEEVKKLPEEVKKKR